MKLLTLNCHSWQEENQREKIKYLAETIKNEKYDVIALQEVSQLKKSKIVYDNVKEDNYALLIIEDLKNMGVEDYNLIWDCAHIAYERYEEGVAILTKHPIIKSESFYVSKTNDAQNWKARKIVKCKVKLEKEIDFLSCHLGWWEDKEEGFSDQFYELINYVEKDKLTFFMGDFNNDANIRGEGYDYILSKNVFDTYNLSKSKDSGTTVKGKIAGWEENNKEIRLDLILCNKKIEVKSSKVIFNGKNLDIISDHFGVEVEI